MFTVIILFCSVCIIGSVAISYYMMAHGDGKRLMGVSMTKEGAKHPKTQAVVRDYKRRLKRFLLLMAALHIPLLPFINWYTSVFIALYTVWCLCLFLGARQLFHKGFLAVYQLKQEYGWTSGGASGMTDDDEYRLRGYYCNPNDPRLLISSPGGMNWELNLGRPAGRVLLCLSRGGLAVLMTVLIAFFAAMDFIPFGMEVDQTQVRITAPVYGTSIPVDEILSVGLSDELPVYLYTRTNGAATDQYDLGHFRQKDGTKVLMYYYKDHSPVIRIDLEDRLILFNTKNPEKTKALYEELVTVQTHR